MSGTTALLVVTAWVNTAYRFREDGIYQFPKKISDKNSLGCNFLPQALA
jgi:hypothetical protein